MRRLSPAIVFLILVDCAFAQDVATQEARAKLVQPEMTNLVVCLSDVVDRSKARGMSRAEFEKVLPNSCPDEFRAFRQANLERLIPLIEKDYPTSKMDARKREELVTFASRAILVPMFNEFSGHSPYRYRMKDAEKRKTPTTEDLAHAAAKQEYTACLARFAETSRAAGVSADKFKSSLDNACGPEADAVSHAERRLWDTYVNPPANRDAAGRIFINTIKMATLRKYSEVAK